MSQFVIETSVEMLPNEWGVVIRRKGVPTLTISAKVCRI